MEKHQGTMLKKVGTCVWLLLLMSCNSIQERKLRGEWKAVDVLEASQSLDVPLEEIQLGFLEDGRYYYKGTLQYREAGLYYLSGSYLYTSDTLEEEPIEKVVEILKLTSDSLILKMEENNAARILKMVKK